MEEQLSCSDCTEDITCETCCSPVGFYGWTTYEIPIKVPKYEINKAIDWKLKNTKG